MKMQGMNKEPLKNTILQEERDKPGRVPRRKHSYQCARTTNEKDDKKEICMKIQQ